MGLIIVGARISSLVPREEFLAYSSPKIALRDGPANPEPPSAAELEKWRTEELEDRVAADEAFWMDLRALDSRWPRRWAPRFPAGGPRREAPRRLAAAVEEMAEEAQLRALASLSEHGGRLGENVGFGEKCGKTWAEDAQGQLPRRLHVSLKKTEFFIRAHSPSEDHARAKALAHRFKAALARELEAVFGVPARAPFEPAELKGETLGSQQFELAVRRGQWRSDCATAAFIERSPRAAHPLEELAMAPFAARVLAQSEARELRECASAPKSAESGKPLARKGEGRSEKEGENSKKDTLPAAKRRRL